MWTTRTLGQGQLKEAFAREEYAGLQFSFRLRLVALLVIAAWLVYSVPIPRVFYYLGLITLFIILGAVPLLLRRYGRWGMGAIGAVALLDAGLLTYALLAPNPLFETTWPPQVTLRFHNFLYFFVFLAGAALSYSPGHVLWSGIAAAAMWSLGVYSIWSRPDTVTAVAGSLTDPEGFLSPYFVNVVTWQNEVVLMLVVAGLLAAAVWRSRRLVLRQVAAEQARSNLARYFSPNLVDQLARTDRPFDSPRSQHAAVLFVDIVNFTAMAERMEPERVFALLRSFHHRMCGVVFAHHGTIDKYIGDAVLATFGTPQPGPTDATNALHCARDMLLEIDRWNEKRAARGAETIDAGIGSVRPLTRVLVVSRDPTRTEGFVKKLRLRGLPAESAGAEDAVRAADIIVTATTAAAPLFRADWVRPGTHVSSMGSDSQGKQELPPELFPVARLFCDLPEQSARIGEFQHAAPNTVLTAIGDVLSSNAKGRQSAEDITVFDSSGISLQDLYMAQAILAAAKAIEGPTA